MTIDDFDENIKNALNDAAAHWIINNNPQPMVNVVCVLLAKTVLVSYTNALEDISKIIKKEMD